MDAFFASVEQLEDPTLRGRPVLVGYDRPRGVVAAASYEARKFGCHSAMPMAVAKRLCPHAAIVAGGYGRYRAYSQRVFAILNDFTPQVEPVSIDEAFCDVTASRRLLGDPVRMAQTIRQRVRDEVRLTASVGVAPNKFLAKLASDMNKPDGLTVIAPEQAQRVLAPLPVGRVWGIGPKMAARLEAMNLRTIGDLCRLGPQWMLRLFGSDAEHYRRLAEGLDDRPVVVDSQAKQISQETTFETDLTDPDAVRQVILAQCEQVGYRLRRAELKAGGASVKIRYGDFTTITRSHALAAPTDVTVELWQAARSLFDGWAAGGFQPVRLIGVAVDRLGSGAAQLPLFADPQRDQQRRLDRVLDTVVDRLGKGAIRRGGV